jgi:hypothetical protein
VLVVHEFVTPETDSAKQRRNAADLDAFLARLGAAPRTTAGDGAWLAGPFTVPGNDHLPSGIPLYVGKFTTRVASRTTVAPVSAAPRPAEGRRPVELRIPAGARVIKLNRHPLGCPCGCARNATIVLNRPGRHPRQNVRKGDLDDALLLMREWALDAMERRDGGTQNPASTFDVGGGMTTLTLTVLPAGTSPRFVVRHWDTTEEHQATELDTALRQIRDWLR